MRSIHDFAKLKYQQEKITMVTCYDHWTAKIINQTNIDCILVGDSVAMVMHGYDSTIAATVEMMALHTNAVVRGASDKFIISDLPFLSYRKGHEQAMDAVERLMRQGAHAIKLEGADGNLELIEHIVKSGVPVMGHIGLTPQSIHQLGGFKVQGREDSQAAALLDQAKQLEAAGCFSLVLECVPASLAEQITQQLDIPTIGIGAGVATDGQVLVLQDLLGVNPEFKPKLLKTYLNGYEMIHESLNAYVREVKDKVFPDQNHTY